MEVAPGMTAEVTVYCNAEENQLSVAASALFHEKTSTYVWIYNPSGSKVEKREVKIALDGPQGRVNIASGVKNGEQVVTAGVHYLVEGQKVQPIKTPSVTNIGGLL